MNVKFYMNELPACGHIRAEVVAREINMKFQHCHVDVKSLWLVSDVYGTDLMVFQRKSDRDLFGKMRLAQSQGIKCAYEIDDDLLNIPPGFQKPYDYYKQPEVRDTIRMFLQYSDAVIVSTTDLAKAYSDLTRKTIYIVPNYLDCQSWELAEANRRASVRDTVTIGWMASGSHQIDTPLIKDALGKLMAEFPQLRLAFIGWIGFEDLGEWSQTEEMKKRIQVLPWIDINTLPHAMGMFDIGIAPLINEPFNLVKSNVKWLQYSALGIPTVASPLPPYSSIKDGETGFLAKDESAWYDVLKRIVSNKELREKIGAQARREVLTNWDLRNKAGTWVQTFESIIKQG